MKRIDYAYGRYGHARFWGKIDSAWHATSYGAAYWPRSWINGALGKINRWAYARFHYIEHQQRQCGCEWLNLEDES